MSPSYKLPDRTELGHDVDGNQYKVVFKNDKEISRTPTGKRIVWLSGYGITAGLGIKQFKKEARQRDNGQYLIEVYKQNAWNSPHMRDLIAKTALKSPPKPKKAKKTLEKAT